MSYQGRLATTGQTHDTENLAGINIKRDIEDANNSVVYLERFLFRDPLPGDRLKHLRRGITKNL